MLSELKSELRTSTESYLGAFIHECIIEEVYKMAQVSTCDKIDAFVATALTQVGLTLMMRTSASGSLVVEVINGKSLLVNKNGLR